MVRLGGWAIAILLVGFVIGYFGNQLKRQIDAANEGADETPDST